MQLVDRPLIQVRSLGKRFQRGSMLVDALEDINLEIYAGECVAIMGPSGSGKSTLLHLIDGLDVPSEGEVLVGGIEPGRLGSDTPAWRAKNIGIVFQQSHLIPGVNAARNVELPLLLTRLGRKERRERVALALDLVGLSHRSQHYAHELSGGEEQRVAIARAIVSDPQILICDEPTGSLDQKSAHDISALLQSLAKQLSKTLIVVSHDPHVRNYVDRVIYLDKGAIAHAPEAYTDSAT